MTIKEFIQKAIEGGLTYDGTSLLPVKQELMTKEELVRVLIKNIEKVVLNPKFWEAVGKVEGWTFCGKTTFSKTPPEHYAHEMITCLFEGGTIESYLETL